MRLLRHNTAGPREKTDIFLILEIERRDLIPILMPGPCNFPGTLSESVLYLHRALALKGAMVIRCAVSHPTD